MGIVSKICAHREKLKLNAASVRSFASILAFARLWPDFSAPRRGS